MKPIVGALLLASTFGQFAEATEGVVCASEGYVAVASWTGGEVERVAVVSTRVPLGSNPVVELPFSGRGPVTLGCRPGRLHIQTPDGTWRASGLTGRHPELAAAGLEAAPIRASTRIGCAALDGSSPAAPTRTVRLTEMTDERLELRTRVTEDDTSGERRIVTYLGEEVAKRFERQVVLFDTLCPGT